MGGFPLFTTHLRAKTSFGDLRGAPPPYLRRKNGTHGKQHIEQSSLAPLCKAAGSPYLNGSPHAIESCGANSKYAFGRSRP